MKFAKIQSCNCENTSSRLMQRKAKNYTVIGMVTGCSEFMLKYSKRTINNTSKFLWDTEKHTRQLMVVT